MGKFQDISGMRFNKLIAVNYIGNSLWNCLCDCGNYHIVRSSELKNGHVKSCGCLRKKYTIDETFFNHIDTEEKAYVLGLIASDGNVTTNPYNIKIDLKVNDEDVLYKVMKAMNYNFNIKHYIQKSQINDKSYVIEISRLNITNKDMVLKIIEYGIVPNKTEYLNFDFSCMDNNLIRHFIRGYFDGDGSIAIDSLNRVAINITSNKNMIDKFVEIFDANIIGYKPHVYVRHKENDNCKTIVFTKNDEKIQFLNLLYKDSNIYMDRKFIKAQQALCILKKTQTTN